MHITRNTVLVKYKKKIKQSPKSARSGYPRPIQRSLDVCMDVRDDDRLLKLSEAACHDVMRCSFATLDAQIEKRAALHDRARTDLEFRKQQLTIAKGDVVAFINAWCWTQDPRLAPGPTTIPFTLFPRQVEYIRWREERRQQQENGIVRKSRDMGLTWMNCASQLHAWMFEPGYKGALGSRKEILVDRLGDMDSIFEKIRFLIRCLPSWMIPDHEDNFCKLINNENGAALTGEAGPQIGRGGRSSVYDVDEAEYLEQDKKVDGALSETSRIIIFSSTVNLWNPANIIRSKIRKGVIPVFKLHWTQDPRKDQAWYDSRTKKLDALVVASEIDMDDNASGEDAIIPIAWVRAAMDRWQDRKLLYSHLGVDVARGGADQTILAGRLQNWCDRLVDYPGTITPDGDIVARYVIAAMSSVSAKLIEPLDRTELARYARQSDCAVHIDVVGVGSSPFDLLRLLGVKTLRGLSGGEKSVDKRGRYKTDRTGKLGFYNRRAEWWWNLRELLDPAYGFNLELPPDDDLLADLTTPRWGVVPVTDPNRISDTRDDEERIMGMIRVESKEDFKKRIGGRSPDRGDAVVYAFAEVEERGNKADWLRRG